MCIALCRSLNQRDGGIATSHAITSAACVLNTSAMLSTDPDTHKQCLCVLTSGDCASGRRLRS